MSETSSAAPRERFAEAIGRLWWLPLARGIVLLVLAGYALFPPGHDRRGIEAGDRNLRDRRRPTSKRLLKDDASQFVASDSQPLTEAPSAGIMED